MSEFGLHKVTPEENDLAGLQFPLLFGFAFFVLFGLPWLLGTGKQTILQWLIAWWVQMPK